ncbi:hypothetical protein M422DRAFT_254982 [Sphaerobolus stellatus SS14]|uniref:MARVEL domain-containing protein n=1 Tax=Sphaerobolus stellatus (strain SS14) TaxID=990650 RepID=A0A0C9V543_SPHS4|nr:hypothetical protein M422DRAFT_254982 [Sphaerobolus stellatus SS14]
MVAATKKEVPTGPAPKFVPGFRSIFYLTLWVLIFALTVSELGLVSQQIHKYGRNAENYASLQYKNSLGLLLCAVLVSLILSLTHFKANFGIVSFFALVLATFFGTGAGIIRTSTPFRGHGCSTKSVESYDPKWRPYVQECSRIVAIEGVAWSLWVLYIVLLVGIVTYKIGFRLKSTPGGFYSV